MDIKQKYGLRDIINAAGTFTPIGVSRSSPTIAKATAEALKDHFIMEELQQAASKAVARWSGSEAGAVTHCTAASITLSVAASMAGSTPEAVAALPDTSGMPNRVVLPAGHEVNYGQPITQAVRLSGAQPILAGTDEECSLADLEPELSCPGTACLLLVSSRLTRGLAVDMKAAVGAAHKAGIPAIIDAAAQDMRLADLLATGADLVLISAHKYLTSPTAGLVVGEAGLVNAVRAHEKGIGRGMKASKEAICGVLAAIEERKGLDLEAWWCEQNRKVTWLKKRLNPLPGLSVTSIPDPAGMPLSRLRLRVTEQDAGMDAATLSARMKDGSPSIWVIDRTSGQGELYLELVQLSDDELALISDVMTGLLQPS